MLTERSFIRLRKWQPKWARLTRLNSKLRLSTPLQRVTWANAVFEVALWWEIFFYPRQITHSVNFVLFLLKEVVNLDPFVKLHLDKLASVRLCSSSVGQVNKNLNIMLRLLRYVILNLLFRHPFIPK